VDPAPLIINKFTLQLVVFKAGVALAAVAVLHITLLVI
jgi:hypothetical protein